MPPAWHRPRDGFIPCIRDVRDPEAALVPAALAGAQGSHVSFFPSSLLLLPFCSFLSQLFPTGLGCYIPVLQEEATRSLYPKWLKTKQKRFVDSRLCQRLEG